MLKLIQLIYCKLVWFENIDFIFKKKYSQGSLSKQFTMRFFLATNAVIALIFCVILDFIFGDLFKQFIIIFILTWLGLQFAIWRYLRKCSRKSRVIYNIKYMKSKIGVVVPIIYMCTIFAIWWVIAVLFSK